MARSSHDRDIILICVLLVLATAGVYWQVSDFGFVYYDDNVYVIQNPMVLRGLTWEGVKWAFTTSSEANWHPLIYLSLMTDVTLAGPRPEFMHVVNVAMHICAALLLFAALNAMTGKKWRSALVAGLFALHPLQVESVAWIAERKDVLSAIFWMLTVLAYLRYVRNPERANYALVLCVFALGLMAKSMLVTLPIVLLLLDYWPLQRLKPALTGQPEDQPTKDRKLPRLLLEKVPMLAMSLVAGGLTIWAQTAGGSMRGLESYPIGVRLANTPVAYLSHLSKAFWPDNLAVFYPHPGNTLPGWKVGLSAAAFVSLTAVAVIWRRTRPYLLVGWLWYIIVVLPVIGLFQSGDQARCDHHTYLPIIGLFIAVVWLVSDLAASRGLVASRFASVGATLILLILAITAYRQTGYWRDGVALFSHAIVVTGKNAVAEHGLGSVLYSRGDYEGAILHCRRALAINPKDINARYSLALALANAGDINGAETEYKKVLKQYPKHPYANNALGDIYYDRAEAALNKSDFAQADAYYRRAETYYRLALRVMPDSMRDMPESAVIHNSLGLCAVKMGQLDKAIKEFGMAIKLDPSFEEARNNLERARALKGEVP